MKAHLNTLDTEFEKYIILHDTEGNTIYQPLHNTVGIREMPDGRIEIDRYKNDKLTVKETMSEIISERVAVKECGQHWAEPEDITALEYTPKGTVITFRKRWGPGDMVADTRKDWPFFNFLASHVNSEILCSNAPENQEESDELTNE